MSKRILIADDHRIVREGLRVLLEAEAGLEVVGEAETGRQAIDMARDLKPTVVVLDVAMPEMNGVEACRLILEEQSKIKVIALSMHSDARFVRRMFQAGASAYLLKDCAYDELAKAIRIVTLGRTYLSGQITAVVMSDYISRRDEDEADAYRQLTDREREVLQLLAEGASTKEIASELIVSVKTIETHRKNIMTKLSLGSVAELTKYAIREGITSLD